MNEIVITLQNQNQRLDKYLLKRFNTAPKSLIYKLLRKKRIKLNDKKAYGHEILRQGDVLRFYLAEDTMNGFMAEKKVRPALLTPEIIYEDENILIANKPAGVLSIPSVRTGKTFGDKAGFRETKIHKENSSRHASEEESMIDRILFYLYEKGEYDTGKTSDFTPALCNRLDRNTSGLVLCGKNLAALQQLNAAMAGRKVEKDYLTLVKGRVGKSGSLKGLHYKDEKRNMVRIEEKFLAGAPENGSQGHEVVTEYAPVQTNGEYTLLRVRLITGKSHQIRVHMRNMGYPVLGDPKYGDDGVNAYFKEKYGLCRQLLHGEKIVFSALGKPLEYLNGREFSAPVDKLFQEILMAQL